MMVRELLNSVNELLGNQFEYGSAKKVEKTYDLVNTIK